MKSKLHGAQVTQTELHYEGSITIDADLMQRADIIENERVQVVNMENGSRLETYVITGPAGSGTICLNGPAARLCATGDSVHIISYVILDEAEARSFESRVLTIKEGNTVAEH